MLKGYNGDSITIKKTSTDSDFRFGQWSDSMCRCGHLF
jgi:hypothetical protein